MIPGAVAVTVQVLLTDMHPLATITIRTPAELPVTIVVIVTYLVQVRQGAQVDTVKQSKEGKRVKKLQTGKCCRDTGQLI